MQKSTKIITIILASTVALCCILVGISVAIDSDYEEVPISSATESTTLSTTEITTTIPTTESTTAASVSQLIIGKWTDSANMSGFEFFEGNKVSFTYVNLSSFNIPFEGKANNGVYEILGDELTIKYSIYTATISKKYKVSIEGNILTMLDIEENETLTYQRDFSDDTTTSSSTSAVSTTGNSTAQQQQTVDDLIGSWISVDGTIVYKFNYDGTAEIKLNKAIVPSLGSSAVSGVYNGVYLTEGNKITIQYTADSVKITNTYTYNTTVNSLNLIDSTGSPISFAREGTAYIPVSEDELLGVWRDGVNMSGYEFKQDGIVKITVVNLTIPIIDSPINSTFTGTYQVKGNEITIGYSIYGNHISETYTYSIENNILSLKNVSNNNISTYIKQ